MPIATNPCIHPPTPLRLRRVSLGMRQNDLAAAAGISVDQLHRLEKGDCEPMWRTARRLALALALPPEELFPDHPAGARDAGK